MQQVQMAMFLKNISMLGAALFNAVMATLMLVALGFVLGTPVTWKIIYLPLAVAPIALLTLGAAWFLASLSVFLRDTGQIVALGITILMFASPIFYPPEGLPASWRSVLDLNPLTQPIEQARAAVIFDRTPDFNALAGVTALGLVVAWLGWLWFQKTRKGFADVL
jgi:lipopolysaccharide transport system permease protein